MVPLTVARDTPQLHKQMLFNKLRQRNGSSASRQDRLHLSEEEHRYSTHQADGKAEGAFTNHHQATAKNWPPFIATPDSFS